MVAVAEQPNLEFNYRVMVIKFNKRFCASANRG
jgi:hypothetical protein